LDSTGATKCCENILTKEMYDKLDNFITELKIDLFDLRRKGNLIQVLHKAQQIFGYLPEEIQLHVAKKLNLSHSEVSGVISFYNYFTTKPKGKYKVAICMGTACFVKGADKILQEFEKNLNIKAGEVSKDMEYSIDVVRCIGACGLAPVVTINDKVYGKISKEDVSKILSEYITNKE
jgi:NADH:ubiquinone oxidoreductase subunit E